MEIDKKILLLFFMFLCCCILSREIKVGAAEYDDMRISYIDVDDLLSETDVDLERVNNQAKSIELNRMIMSEYYKGYYEGFAGTFLDDNGNLVLNVTEACNERLSEIAKIYGIKKNFVDYSFDELFAIRENLIRKCDLLRKFDIEANEFAICIRKNQVEVGIERFDELDDEKLEFIYSILNEGCVKLKNSGIKTRCDVEIRGGYEISSSNGSSTVGFCAVRGSDFGFVIAGHAYHYLNQVFSYNGTAIGTGTATAYYNGSKADAAFLTKTSNATTSNNLMLLKIHSYETNNSEFPENSLIFMKGAASGVVSGTIDNLSVQSIDLNMNPAYTLYDQVRATYTSTQGDSGGPVFILTGNLNGYTTCKLLGINRGTDGNGYGIFSKYHNIANALQLTALTY